MLLRYRLIGALSVGAVACVSCIVAASAQSSVSSPALMTLCASLDVRLADQAIEACSAIIAASDNDKDAAATAYGYRGIALQRRARNAQDGEAALRDLEKAVGAGLDTAIAYVFRSQLHLLQQNPDLALADSEKAIRLDPQLALAYAVRGGAFAAKQDFERVAIEYGEAIRIDPTYTIAFLARARAYSARSDWSRAIADLDRALQLDSTSRLAADALASRAHARIGQSDIAGAIADCDAALALTTGDDSAMRGRAWAFVTRARAFMMRTDWSPAAGDAAEPEPWVKAYSFTTEAAARIRMSDVDSAIADCDEALKLIPGDREALRLRTPALLTRARVAMARFDWSLAVRDLDDALQFDWRPDARAHLFTTRATARIQMSNFAGAIADCDEALKLVPGNREALSIRASAHGGRAMPDVLTVYVAHGPAGACGGTCEEWIAVEGTVDREAPKRLIAALDRLGARKLPVALNFQGASDFRSAMNIGRILRGRGFEATSGQTQVDGCDDPFQAKCMEPKRAGKPVQATLVPSKFCDVACVLGLAGGVQRTLSEATTVIIAGVTVGNWFGVHSAEPYREGGHVRTPDLVKLHLTQMGVDPRLADMMEENYVSARSIELSRADVARLRIVTTQ